VTGVNTRRRFMRWLPTIPVIGPAAVKAGMVMQAAAAKVADPLRAEFAIVERDGGMWLRRFIGNATQGEIEFFPVQTYMEKPMYWAWVAKDRIIVEGHTLDELARLANQGYSSLAHWVP
jgi:hypothetical protein